MTANIFVTSPGLQLKTAPVGRTVGSLSQQEILTFYTACFHTTQSTEPVPSHKEQGCTSDKPSALSQEITPHLPPEENVHQNPAGISHPSGFFSISHSTCRECSPPKWSLRRVEYVQDVPLRSKQMKFWHRLLLTSSSLCLVLPSAQGILCSLVLKSNLQV